MKILYVTTIGITMTFFKSFIEVLLEDGHEVEIATNSDIAPVPKWYSERDFKVHTISCSRSPMDRRNILAIRQIKKLVEENGYDIVHCHTPVAAACTRIACREARKRGTRVFYTAHGFHFYKGAPLKNWLIFYPIERICSYWTDVLITINEEDYGLAKKRMKAGLVTYVPGVGIDIKSFGCAALKREDKLAQLGVPVGAKVLLSVGELNENKNHQLVVRAIAQSKDKELHYIVAGDGYNLDKLDALANELGVSDNVSILGYRTDVRELYAASDCFVFPSYREGLSVSLMEAMVSGLPCAVSRIRGNIDLIDENGGALFNPESVEECLEAIEKVLSSKDSMGHYNKEKVIGFSHVNVCEKLIKLYEEEND